MSLDLEIEVTLPTGQKYLQPTGLFINNEFVKSSDGQTIDTVNPSTGEKIGSVYLATKDDVDTAVKAARNQFENHWSQVDGHVRSKALKQFAAIMEENKDILADIEAMDSGKPRDSNAIYDVAHCIDVLHGFSGLATTAQSGKTIETTQQKFTYTIHEPWGVCGQIIPWNYPLAMAIWKIAPAIATGNTIVMKTAENTPLSLLYLCKLLKEADFPPVMNIICGLGSVAGAHLAEHMDVDKISFTGSTLVGKAICKLASSNLKAVTMECGGKSPMIVYKDADIDQAVKWCAFGVMYNMGQICVACSRVYVEEEIHDEFLKKLIEHVKEVYIQGDAFGKGVQVGPQVSKIQQQRILDYIKSGVEEGAKLELGGSVPKEYENKGFFVEPTIFSNINQSMKIVQEEIFGPVVVVGKFKTDEEAVKLANDTIYGLASYVFTSDIKKSQNFIKKSKSGQVFVNATNGSDFRVPFGGYKMSGFGRELSDYGLSMYTQTKAVHINTGRNL